MSDLRARLIRIDLAIDDARQELDELPLDDLGTPELFRLIWLRGHLDRAAEHLGAARGTISRTNEGNE
jgi:hypothetical protein